MLVFGSGKSGIGAAELLGQVGAEPVIYDGNADLDKEAVVHKVDTLQRYQRICGRASGRSK